MLNNRTMPGSLRAAAFLPNGIPLIGSNVVIRNGLQGFGHWRRHLHTSRHRRTQAATAEELVLLKYA